MQPTLFGVRAFDIGIEGVLGGLRPAARPLRSN
jgi:hypothetical protein